MLENKKSDYPGRKTYAHVPYITIEQLSNEYDDVINGILYETEDSYATARSLYLQNRRFNLGTKETNLDDLEDPYAN